MNRRRFLAGSGVVGSTLVAGCLSGGGASTDDGDVTDGGGEETGTTTTTTRTTTETTTQTTEDDGGGSDPVEDLSAPTVVSTGAGRGTSRRFEALGGPVFLTFTFDFADMTNSNFIARAVDETGTRLPPQVLAINELLAPTQRDSPHVYTARMVTHFEPGSYFVDVTDAGGVQGSGDWELTVEQPGQPTTGQSLPVEFEGFDADVIGPIATDGPIRITFETLEPRLAYDGDPTTYNYQVRTADALGRRGDLLVNSLGPAPETFTVNWFPGEETVGFLNVRSFGSWRAYLEAA